MTATHRCVFCVRGNHLLRRVCSLILLAVNQWFLAKKKISGSADHFLSIRRQTWLTLHQSFFCLPTNFICSTRTISTCLSNSYMAAQWCGFQSMNKSQRFASPSTRCPQKLRLGYHWASLFQPLCGFAFTGRVGIHICQF
jgi:hypothetical protein